MDEVNAQIMNVRSLVLFVGTAFVATIVSVILGASTTNIVFAAIGGGFISVLGDWQRRRRDVRRNLE